MPGEEARFQMHAGVHGGVYKVSNMKDKSVHNGSKPVVSTRAHQGKKEAIDRLDLDVSFFFGSVHFPRSGKNSM